MDQCNQAKSKKIDSISKVLGYWCHVLQTLYGALSSCVTVNIQDWSANDTYVIPCIRAWRLLSTTPFLTLDHGKASLLVHYASSTRARGSHRPMHSTSYHRPRAALIVTERAPFQSLSTLLEHRILQASREQYVSKAARGGRGRGFRDFERPVGCVALLPHATIHDDNFSKHRQLLPFPCG